MPVSAFTDHAAYFYPRSPCGERPKRLGDALEHLHFYPRSPCGERQAADISTRRGASISIHALLAESDRSNQSIISQADDFYPRSPCGERRESQQPSARPTRDFYPRSPCGERLCLYRLSLITLPISIHALLAESDPRHSADCSCRSISIHALLAESDGSRPAWLASRLNFYPRSPCGERRRHRGNDRRPIHFYPRSPCGERLVKFSVSGSVISISIHALLAESDPCYGRLYQGRNYFYPRSPCGERLAPAGIATKYS